MSTRCRYVQGKCFGLGMRGISPCEDRSCPGPKGGEFPAPAADETKPAAPPAAREEEKTMPNPAPSPTGTCPKCHREGVKLMTNKFDAENPRTCPRCYNTAWAADKAKRTGAANVKRAATKAAKKAVAAKAVPAAAATKSPAKAAKAPRSPKEPRPAPIAQPRPKDDGRTYLESVPEPSNSGLRLVFEVRIRPGMTPLEVMDLMRAVPSDAVVAG